MTKIIASTIAAIVIAADLSAATKKDVLAFIKRNVNPSVNVVSLEIEERMRVRGMDGWEKIRFVAKASLTQNGKTTPVTDSPGVVFANGSYIVGDIYDAKQGLMMSEIMAKTPDAGYYTKEALVAGSMTAKNKILVFSDPNCPYCKEFMPEALDVAQKKPSEFAVFLYHMPLEAIHPYSKTIIKLTIAAKLRGANVTEKIYRHEFKGTTEAATIAEFNKITGLKLSSKEILSKKVERIYNDTQEKAKDLAVAGTPWVFTNGKYDPGQKRFAELLR